MRVLFLCGLLALLPAAAIAQIGVGTTTPDTKSALDINATDKGLLIPRLTATQRTGISSPPQGLMVYQTDGTASGGPQTGFWYYAGTGGWVYLDAARLTLPYSGSASSSSPAFSVTNTGTGGGVVGTAASGAGVTAASASGPALAASKTVGQTGRLLSLISPLATNDSTAAYIFSGGERPTLRAVNTASSAQAAIRGVKQAPVADGAGVEGVVTSGASGNAAGVRGLDTSGGGGTAGVLGRTTTGYGVLGLATASGGYGVTGTATDGYGVSGGSTSGDGVHGVSSSAAGVSGASTDGTGVSGTSTDGPGVQGTSASTAGVQGTSSSNDATTGGVVGTNNAGGSAVGVLGTTTNGYGVRGTASASGGYGVSGVATNSFGVRGVSSSGVGVQGNSTSSSGVVGLTSAGNPGGIAGVLGSSSNSSGIGVLGQTSSGYGVRGEATGTSGYGVTGVASNTNGIGVLGSATGAATGVVGQATGTGRAGYFNQTNSSYTGNAVDVAHSGTGYGLHVSSPNQTALFENTNTTGTGSTVLVRNSNTSGVGVKVQGGSVQVIETNASPYETIIFPSYMYLGPDNPSSGSIGTVITGDGAQFRADNASQIGPGQLGRTALFAEQTQSSATNFAGIFFGNLFVSGTLSVSGAKAFQIDHPLDPENKFLFHSCVESPDMMNVYNGNVKLDAQGNATVELPSYFEALNQDFRYQLTAVGAPGPNLYVAEPVRGNKFRIGGGTPGAEVSWQVTGIRHDASARQHRLVPEVAKTPEQQGHYLAPEAFGLPASRGMNTGQAPAATGSTSLTTWRGKAGARVGF